MATRYGYSLNPDGTTVPISTPFAEDSEKFNGKTWETMLTTIYPVGSIYLSVSSTSPASLFGGTWEQLKDRFLLGAGGSYSVDATGGEETHTLTVSEMPMHNHGGYYTNSTSETKHYAYSGWNGSDMAYAAVNAGGGNAHNNMPPYLAVYMWKRVS